MGKTCKYEHIVKYKNIQINSIAENKYFFNYWVTCDKIPQKKPSFLLLSHESTNYIISTTTSSVLTTKQGSKEN